MEVLLVQMMRRTEVLVEEDLDMVLQQEHLQPAQVLD